MFLIGSKVSNRLISPDLCEEEKDKTPFVLFVERLFKLRERKTTLSREIKCGFLHFVSAAFILSVNSRLLSENASYSATKVAANSALSTGVSCILCGFFSNLPFILSPTTSTSIYFALYIQNHNLSIQEGNLVVFLLGILFCLCGIRPIALFITNIIPFVMKVGVCLGVALLIALEAMVEIGLVQTGEHTVLDIGNFTPEIFIAMGAFIVIGLSLHYRIRGAFLIGLAFGALFNWISMIIQNKHVSWSASDIFVDGADMKSSFSDISFSSIKENTVYRLVFDLYVIGVILLNGLAHGLADTAGLKREDSTLPRGKWLYAACGLGTMLSAFISSGPIMISPESAPGIKAGARTGLSAVVCGMLFLLAVPFSPLFAACPVTGTSPVLLMIGMMLFENADKVKWSSVKEALPVFILLIFIPFTYSIFNGVIFGFGIYSILFIFTDFGTIKRRCRQCLPSSIYFACRSICCEWGLCKKLKATRTSSSHIFDSKLNSKLVNNVTTGYKHLNSNDSSNTLLLGENDEDSDDGDSDNDDHDSDSDDDDAQKQKKKHRQLQLSFALSEITDSNGNDVYDDTNDKYNKKKSKQKQVQLQNDIYSPVKKYVQNPIRINTRDGGQIVWGSGSDSKNSSSNTTPSNNDANNNVPPLPTSLQKNYMKYINDNHEDFSSNLQENKNQIKSSITDKSKDNKSDDIDTEEEVIL